LSTLGPHHVQEERRKMSKLTYRTSLPATVAVVCGLLLTGVLGGGSALAAYPGGNGKIAYESAVTGTSRSS
jgi:hypothetical protein